MQVCLFRFYRYCAFFLLLLVASSITFAQNTAPLASNGEYILKFNREQLKKFQSEYPQLAIYPIETIEVALRELIGVDQKDKLALIDASVVELAADEDFDLQLLVDLMRDGLVDYLEPNYRLTINATPNDSSYPSLWGLHNTGQSGGTADIDIDAPEAWNISTGSSGVVVGVVDTGVDLDHPDLAANIWTNSSEIAGNGIDDDGNGVIDDRHGIRSINGSISGNPNDDHNHGTHVAGIIGALGNNATGVVGVNWNVKIMPLKFLDSSGSGLTSDAINVINYAVAMKQSGVNIRVLNNSWGGGGFSNALQEAISAANDAGILFVVAAGNESNNNDSSPTYPSNFDVDNVLSVAAVDRNGNLASFSNYGATTVDLAAPGVNIQSTVTGGGYASQSGTSMAAPYVSGIAALLAAENSSLNVSGMKNRLIGSIQTVSALNGKMLAPGIVNAFRALSNQVNNPPIVDALSDVFMDASEDSRTITVNASDADGDPLTYSASATTGTVSFSGNRLTIDPAQGFLGTFEVVVTVSDGAIQAVRNFNVSVAGNQPPTIDSIGNKKVVTGHQLLVGIAVNDADGDSLSVSLDIPEVSGKTPATAKTTLNTITITPNSGFLGDFTITLNVSDAEHSVSKRFNVTVLSADNAIDTDGDGVFDFQENEDGTDINDAGSFMSRITNSTHMLWNGFLEMVNVLELVNTGFSDARADISFFTIDGTLSHQTRVRIGSQSQTDLILNEFPGFVANSYGLVRVDVSGTLDGRVSYYRSDGATGYEFAFSVPFANPTYGDSAVSFNTYQPSLNPEHANHEVSNWLSIVNLSSSTERFDVYSYDQTGQRIASRRLVVTSFGRVDIDGGHGIAGASVVGYHKILPVDKQAPYIAQLVRYGAKAGAGQPVSGYHFAFPLTARAGNGSAMYVPISKKFGEENWVELINTLNSSARVTITFRNESGLKLSEQTLRLASNGQVHLNASALLESGEIGIATIEPESRNSIIAQSMFYHRDPISGAVSAMYGKHAFESMGQTLVGSYNLYLGMENWLRLTNTTGSEIEVRLSVNRSDGSVYQSFNIPAYGSTNLAIHDNSSYGTVLESYGVVIAQSSVKSSLVAELLRVRYQGPFLDFATPTQLR